MIAQVTIRIVEEQPPLAIIVILVVALAVMAVSLVVMLWFTAAQIMHDKATGAYLVAADAARRGDIDECNRHADVGDRWKRRGDLLMLKRSS